MPNFADILDTPMDAVKPPPLLPEGTYHTVIAGLPESGFSSQKQTPQFTFVHRIVGALDDVDEQELADAFPEGVQGKEIENVLYVTEKSLFMMTDMLKNCGLDPSKSVREALDNVPNCEVGVIIKHEPFQNDKTRFRAKVARTVALS